MSTNPDVMARLAILEAKFNESEQSDLLPVIPRDTEYSAATVTSATSMSLVPITPVAISMPTSGSWASASVAGIPATARALLIYVEYTFSGLPASIGSLKVRQASGATEYQVVRIGSATITGFDLTDSKQYIALVPPSFEYNYSALTLGTIECHGYYT